MTKERVFYKIFGIICILIIIAGILYQASEYVIKPMHDFRHEQKFQEPIAPERQYHI